MTLRQFNTVLAGDIGAKALTALFVLALVRLLQPADFAAYIFISSLVILAATFSSGFFNRHYIMANAAISSARSYRALQVCTSAATFAGIAFALARESDIGTIAAGLACTAAAASYDFRRTHAQKALAFGAWSRAEVLRALLLVALSAPVAWAWGGQALITGLLAAQALAFLLAALALPALPASSSQAAPAGNMLANRGALSLAAYFALVGLFGQLPVLILKGMADTGALASFGSAFRYYGLLLGVVAAANVVILPRIAQTENLAATLRSLVNLLAAAAALVLAACVVGYFTIPFIDGGKYPDAPQVFTLLCLALVPGLVLAPLTAIFLRMDQQHHLLASQIAAIAACAATAWALRSHGAHAVAISVPAGVLAQLMWLIGAARKLRGGRT